jgi:hypothetical protein
MCSRSRPAEAVNLFIQPEPKNLPQFSANLGTLPVETRLSPAEYVQVVFGYFGLPFPHAALEDTGPVARWPFVPVLVRDGIAPDVEVLETIIFALVRAATDFLNQECSTEVWFWAISSITRRPRW